MNYRVGCSVVTFRRTELKINYDYTPIVRVLRVRFNTDKT